MGSAMGSAVIGQPISASSCSVCPVSGSRTSAWVTIGGRVDRNFSTSSGVQLLGSSGMGLLMGFGRLSFGCRLGLGRIE